MKENLEQFMWDKQFKAQYAKIPKGNRQHTTVKLLQKLIVDMHKTGYSYSSIARFLKKDHTTILHHIQQAGIWKPSKIWLTPEEIKMRMEDKLRRKVELEKTKEERRMARVEAGKKLLEQADKKTDIIKNLREEVFKLYKEGKSYNQIGLMTGLRGPRIQALLIYHPDYRSVVRPAAANKGRSVWQLTGEGKRIKKFKNMMDAARETKTQRNAISLVCKGRIPSTAGFKWEYDEPRHPHPTK